VRDYAIQLVDALAYTEGRFGISTPAPSTDESTSLLFWAHDAGQVGYVFAYPCSDLINGIDLHRRREAHFRKVAPPREGCDLVLSARGDQVQALLERWFVEGSIQQRDRQVVRGLVAADPIQALPDEESRWWSLPIDHGHSIGH